MNGKTNIFEKLLGKFRFRHPAPDEVKRFISSYKRMSLVKTLTTLEQYDALFGIVLRAFYLARRLNARVTMAQSRAVVGSAGVLFVSAAVLIGYMLFANVEKPAAVSTVVLPQKIEVPDAIEKIEEKKPAEKEEKIEVIKVKRIGIKPLTSSFMDKETLNSATDALHERLSELKGKERVITIKKGSRGYAYLLKGSMNKLGKTIIISVDLVDAESGRVIYNTLERTDDKNNINGILKGIADKAAEKVKF